MISYIVEDTSDAILQVLGANFLPKTEQEWQGVTKLFAEYWNFSNCLWAIDGKHIVMTQPANSGSHIMIMCLRFSPVFTHPQRKQVVDGSAGFCYPHQRAYCSTFQTWASFINAATDFLFYKTRISYCVENA